MKVAVVGSRTFNNYKLMCEVLDKENITHIISGGARGADTLAYNYAKENAIPITIYFPNWELYGKSAGMGRNIQIVNECDKVIAFWDGKSKGTAHTISIAKQKNKPYIIIQDRFIKDILYVKEKKN